jgi:hypothetical protein
MRRGDVVSLHVLDLGTNYRLRLHRCGPQCNSAEPVGIWDQSQVPADARVVVVVPADGKYYFWVEDISKPTGKYGEALVATASERTSSSLIIHYGSFKVAAADVQPNNSLERTRER